MTEAKELDDRYLNLTDMQRTLLRQIQAVEVGKRVGVRFTDPGSDQENIRRAAYLDGGLDMLQYLLSFDQQLAQDAEDQKQETLQAQAQGTSALGDYQPSF